MKVLSARLLPIPALLRRGFAGAATLLPGLALANPTGGQVVDGKVTITTPSSSGMVVTEGSNSAIVNWQTFSIGGKEYVQFIQPSSSSVILNRVIGNSPSSIFGNLSANGRVFLINPDGVLFAPGSTVDVGALVASTVNISDADFKAGRYLFSGGSAGSGITNKGTITAHDGGFVVLNGDYVHNSGVVQARLGEVVLASGSAMTLSMDKGGLIDYTVDKAALSSKAGIVNDGQLLADGGRVIMTADVAHDLVSTAVNNSGLVRAQGISQHDGQIELTASGGNIVDSGTLDVSSTSGNGGSLQVKGDQDIDLGSTAVLDASGKQFGGNIQVVAGRNLDLRKGGLIEGLASARNGQGGAAELSGHGRFGLAGDVNLGRGGSLTIDPTDVIISNGNGTTNTSTGAYFEQSLENTLAGGTTVNITATNSITLNALADGVLDGRASGANAGNGGSLSLQVTGAGGTIQFLDTSNTIKVDQNLTLNAGSTTGVINVGNLQAGRIFLDGRTSITSGTLKSSLGSMSLSGGNITTGSIDVQNTQLDASSLNINSTGNVTVNGGITVTGGGGSGSVDHNSVQAGAFITASKAVKVSGDITVSGNAFARNTFGSSFDNTGDGELQIQGSKITLAGVTVSGVGDASFTATASQSISIGSAVNVSATRTNIRRTGGSTSINLSGNASILLGASNSSAASALTITTHGLSASGPNAGISVQGATLTLNNGPTGVALSAKAFTGGTSTGGSGAFYQHSYGGGNGLVTTDFGAAAIRVDRVGSGTTKIGSIAVSGPAALLQLQGSGGVTTVNGSISVQASGYTVTGSASQFRPFRLLGSPVRGSNSVGALLRPPVLLEGSTHWGAAKFLAGGPSAGAGDTFNISGGVTVSGLGEADMTIDAAGLTVGGAVSVTASKGSLQGVSTASYLDSTNQSSGTVSRTISNSAGTGAATFGQANVTVNIGNGTNDVSLGSLSVRGLSAQASFQGGRNLTITGNVTVDGQSGGAAPDFKEVAVYVPGAGATVTGSTEWVGDNNFLRVGNGVSPTGTVSLGTVSLSGYGFVDLVVRGQAVSMGNVSVTQGTGLFTSTDTTRYSTSYSVTNPGTTIDLAAASGAVQAASLTVHSTGALAQSLSANFTGAYAINAPSYSAVVSGLTGLPNPLLTPAPTNSAGKLAVPSDKTLLGVSVTAGDITLNISGDLALTTQSLAASQDLSIQTGGNLTLSSNTLAAGNSLSLQATGNLSDTNSSLFSPAVTLDAGGSLTLNNTSIAGSSGGARGSLALTGKTIGLGSGLSLKGTNVALDVTGGNLVLANNVLDASSALTLTASGSVSATNSVLLGDTTTIAGDTGITITDSTVGGSGGSAASTSITMTSNNGTITNAGSTLVEGVTVDLTALGFASNATGATPTISATTLTLNATGGDLDLTPAINLVVSQDMLLESQTGSVNVIQDLSAGGAITVSAANGSVTTQALDAGSGVTITAGSGNINTQALNAGTDVTLDAAKGSVTTQAIAASGTVAVDAATTLSTGDVSGTGGVTLTAGSTLSAGNLTGSDITLDTAKGSVTTQAIAASGTVAVDAATTLSTGTISGASSVTLDAGSTLSAGDISGTGSVTLNAGTTLSTGNITGTDITLDAVNGSVTTQALDAGAGAISVTAGNGDINTQALNAGTDVTLDAAKGSVTTQAIAASGSVAIDSGSTLSTGNISGASSVALNAGTTLAAGNITGTGSVTLDAGTTLSTGDIGGASNVNLTAGTALSTGNISGASSIDLTAGTTLTTGNDSATGNITLSGGTGITLTNDVLAAGGLLSLTADAGDIRITNATLSGSGITLAATTGTIGLDNSLLSGGTIGAVAGSSIDITHSALGGPLGSNGSTPATLIALSANGGDLTLDDATALTGDAIGLFASGSITSANPNGATRINAGALSVQAFDTIDLSQATLTIGSGIAQFGSDAALLQQIAQQSGGRLVLPSIGPNASFKAKVVNLGTLQTQTAGADLYLYIESQATSSGLGYSIASIANAGDALLDYNLYGGDVQVVNLPAGARPLIGNVATTTPTPLTINGAVNAPAGLTTLIIGSSLYGGDITVNPGTVFTPNDPASVNLVFATTGKISGASNLHTTGYVLLLNQVASTPVTLPITPGDYTPPPTGELGSPQPAPEDPDDPGVNGANEGTIVQQTSSQGVLSACSGT